MKKESNIIDTKDDLIKNFSKEQLEIYNHYMSKFSYNDSQHYLAVQEDKKITFLEKSCDILNFVLKIEIIMALIVGTIVFMLNGLPNLGSQVKYKQAKIETSIIEDNDFMTKI